jgi:hypothetical protein
MKKIITILLCLLTTAIWSQNRTFDTISFIRGGQLYRIIPGSGVIQVNGVNYYSFPGFGVTHSTAAYGDHLHPIYEPFINPGPVNSYFSWDKTWRSVPVCDTSLFPFYRKNTHVAPRNFSDTLWLQNLVKFPEAGTLEAVKNNDPGTKAVLTLLGSMGYAGLTAGRDAGVDDSSWMQLSINPYVKTFNFEGYTNSGGIGRFAYQLDEYGFYPTAYSAGYLYNQYIGVPGFPWSDGYMKKLHITQLPTGSATDSIRVTKNGEEKRIAASTFSLSTHNHSGSYVSSVSATAPLVSSGGMNPAISLPEAGSASAGYLSAANFSLFNAKEPAISAGSPGQYWAWDKTWKPLQWSESGTNLYYGAGSVGIGTSSPATTFETIGTIKSTSSTNESNCQLVGATGFMASTNVNGFAANNIQPYNAEARMRFRRWNGTYGSPSAIQSGNEIGHMAACGYNGSAMSNIMASVRFFAEENWTTTANGINIIFETTRLQSNVPATRMKITSGGNILINGPTPYGTMGTSAMPFQIFHDGAVFGNSCNNAILIESNIPGGSNTLLHRTSAGSKASPLALSDGNSLGGITVQGMAGSTQNDWSGNRGSLSFNAEGPWTSTSQGVSIIFKTNDAALATPSDPLERVRITSAGRVGVGTSAPTAYMDISANTIRLRTARTIATSGSAGNQGDICWDASYLYICVAANTWRRVSLSSW